MKVWFLFNLHSIYLHLIFEKSSLKNLSWINLIFCLFQTWILQDVVKVKFKLDKKSCSSNLIFQIWFKKIWNKFNWNSTESAVSQLFGRLTTTNYRRTSGSAALMEVQGTVLYLKNFGRRSQPYSIVILHDIQMWTELVSSL